MRIRNIRHFDIVSFSDKIRTDKHFKKKDSLALNKQQKSSFKNDVDKYGKLYQQV